MAKRPTKVALIYDFDETLSTGYMQDFSLIPALGMKPDRFWKMANQCLPTRKPTRSPALCTTL